MTSELDEAQPVVCRAPAKINLSLRVGQRRADGYHGLATIFHAVSLFEIVTVAPSDGLELEVRGAGSQGVPIDESNLAMKAARHLAWFTGHEPKARIVIDKSIPVAGGLAGGSADAAATLVALNRLWGTGLKKDWLVKLGSNLGADVAFSVHGFSAIGLGKGEKLTHIECPKQIWWVLACRRVGLLTPQVYAEFDRLTRPSVPVVNEHLLQAIRRGEIARIGELLENDLQQASFALMPELRLTRDAALDAGALGSIVSGSGPTVAALAASEEDAERIAALLRALDAVDAVYVANGPAPGAYRGLV